MMFYGFVALRIWVEDVLGELSEFSTKSGEFGPKNLVNPLNLNKTKFTPKTWPHAPFRSVFLGQKTFCKFVALEIWMGVGLCDHDVLST